VVAVALNLDSADAVETGITLDACGALPQLRAFRYTAGNADLMPTQLAQPWTGGQRLVDVLPPESITVYEVAATTQGATTGTGK
jgi:hypothetical protein